MGAVPTAECLFLAVLPCHTPLGDLVVCYTAKGRERAQWATMNLPFNQTTN